jgi:hypothetical protein
MNAALTNNYESAKSASHCAVAHRAGMDELVAKLFEKAESYGNYDLLMLKLPCDAASLLRINGRRQEGEQNLRWMVEQIKSSTAPLTDKRLISESLGHMSVIYTEALKGSPEGDIFSNTATRQGYYMRIGTKHHESHRSQRKEQDRVLSIA